MCLGNDDAPNNKYMKPKYAVAGAVQKVCTLLKNSGRACKPDCPGTSMFSITCLESTNTGGQRSQFWPPKQVLWHSYVTVARLSLRMTLLFSPSVNNCEDNR